MKPSFFSGFGVKFAGMFRQRLYQNAGYLLMANYLPGLVGFVFWALAGNLYGAHDIGLASVVISAATLLAMLANLGLSIGLIRFLPAASDRPRLLQTVFIVNLVTGILFALGYLAGAPWWAAKLTAELGGVTFNLVFVTLVSVIAVGAIVRDAFVAYREAKYSFAYTLVSQLARVVLIFPFVGRGSLGLVTSTMLAFILALAFSAGLHLRKVEPAYRLTSRVDVSMLGTLIPFSLGSHLTNLLLVLPQLVFPMLILELLGPVPSAHAYIPLMIGWMITGPAVALLNSAFAESSNDHDGADRILWRTGGVAIGVSLITAVAVYSLAAPLLSLFGPEYTQNSSGLLRLLALASPFITFNQAYINYLRIYKKVKLMTLLNLFLSAMIMGLAVVAIPRLGINGSGVSVLAAYIIMTAVSSVIIWRERHNRRSLLTEN